MAPLLAAALLLLASARAGSAAPLLRAEPARPLGDVLAKRKPPCFPDVYTVRPTHAAPPRSSAAARGVAGPRSHGGGCGCAPPPLASTQPVLGTARCRLARAAAAALTARAQASYTFTLPYTAAFLPQAMVYPVQLWVDQSRERVRIDTYDGLDSELDVDVRG